MSRPVFHAAAEDLHGIRPGGTVTFTGPDARHAATVRRVRTGEVIDLVDGAGLRVRGVVADATGGGTASVTINVTHVTLEPAPANELVLVQALAKGGRDERAIETATEVGLDRVVPWQANRSVSQWRGDKATKGVARWEQVLLSAAKQSRRARTPAVDPLVVTTQLTGWVSEQVQHGDSVLVLHEEATTPVAQAKVPVTVGRVAVVVGPEGGLTDREVDSLCAAGAQPVRLGPHVLRTSTAGPIALALLAQRLGHWA